MNQPPLNSTILLIADSHGKTLPFNIYSSKYHLISYCVSGLRWIHSYDTNLCTYTLIQKEPYSSLLSTCSRLIFLVGSNSVRNLPANHVIEQVKTILNFLHRRYEHLKLYGHIMIIATFPSAKLSYRFDSISSLADNIDRYNDLLSTLSSIYQFTFIDFKLPSEFLSSDKLHIDPQHQSFVIDNILKHINSLQVLINTSDDSTRRSLLATTSRNKKRRVRQQLKQKTFTLIRTIDPIWSWQHLKFFLKQKNIKYAFISNIYHHKLRLRFNNLTTLHHAEDVLHEQTFNATNFDQWIMTHPI